MIWFAGKAEDLPARMYNSERSLQMIRSTVSQLYNLLLHGVKRGGSIIIECQDEGLKYIIATFTLRIATLMELSGE